MAEPVPLPARRRVCYRGDTLGVSTTRPEDDAITTQTWLALVAMGLGVFVIADDFTALSVAIPRIEQDLHTTLSGAQWVINGYALLFGVLIVTGGRLADLLGRKRMFMAGASIFALFSLLCGVVPDVGLLVACRALMGVGGALMWPAILGLTYSLLPGDRKGLAGGLILGVAGLGNTVGPLLGGWLTHVASWRLVFFVNLPVTAFAMLVTRRQVPESRVSGAEHGIDYPAVALLSAGAIAILIGLDLANADGSPARSSWPCWPAAWPCWPCSCWPSAAWGNGPWCPPWCCATGCSRRRVPRCC